MKGKPAIYEFTELKGKELKFANLAKLDMVALFGQFLSTQEGWNLKPKLEHLQGMYKVYI